MTDELFRYYDTDSHNSEQCIEQNPAPAGENLDSEKYPLALDLELLFLHLLLFLVLIVLAN